MARSIDETFIALTVTKLATEGRGDISCIRSALDTGLPRFRESQLFAGLACSVSITRGTFRIAGDALVIFIDPGSERTALHASKALSGVVIFHAGLAAAVSITGGAFWVAGGTAAGTVQEEGACWAVTLVGGGIVDVVGLRAAQTATLGVAGRTKTVAGYTLESCVHVGVSDRTLNAGLGTDRETGLLASYTGSIGTASSAFGVTGSANVV